MKYIISGTNRPGSRTMIVSKIVQSLYQEMNEVTEIIDLADVSMHEVHGVQYQDNQPEKMKAAISKIAKADGLIIVCPEYNGSMPGVLKYFMDHWKFPESYEFRPMCLIGLGGMFGALRPVEHLQGTLGYRNAFIYPERVFLMNVWNIMKDGEITDPAIMTLLRSQAAGFSKFCSALSVAGIDANSRLKNAGK